MIGNLWLQLTRESGKYVRSRKCGKVQQLLNNTIAGYITERPITQRNVIVKSEDYIGQFLILGNKSEDTLILQIRNF